MQHRFAIAYSLNTGINATYFSTNNYGQFVEPALYTSMMNDYGEMLPAGFNDYWDYDGLERFQNQLEAALSGSWCEWMYYERGTPSPVTFEIYTNTSARNGSLESVAVNNRTHIIKEWKAIYGYFNPVESFIEILWTGFIPSFDYLLEMTPRLSYTDSSIAFSENGSSSIDVSSDVGVLGKWIGTIDGLRLQCLNGTLIHSEDDTFPAGETASLDFILPLGNLAGQSLTLQVGNDYIGYLSLNVTIPAEEQGLNRNGGSRSNCWYWHYGVSGFLETKVANERAFLQNDVHHKLYIRLRRLILVKHQTFDKDFSV